MRALRRGGRAAALLDAAAVVLACLFGSIAAFGGIRLTLGPATLSVTSAWRVLLVLLVVVGLRHVLAPEPSWRARSALALERVRARLHARSWRLVLPVWASTRLGVIAVGFMAVSIVGLPEDARGIRAVSHPLIDLAHRWDTGWYLAIALNGYGWDPSRPEEQQSVAFFPAYPMLMRTGGALIGARSRSTDPAEVRGARLTGRTLLAGWLLSLGSFLWALCALHAWAVRVAGPPAARRAVMLIAAFPFALYYSAAYTESLFLLAAVGAFNGMSDRQALRAGAWGLLAGLLRPNGFLLSLPLGILAAGPRAGRVRHLLAAAMPVVGALVFSTYIWALTGDPLTWVRAHAAWGRTAPTWESTVVPRAETVAERGVAGYVQAQPYDILNGAALLFACTLLPAVWRRLGPAPAVFVASNLVPPLLAGGLMSVGRLTSTMFPLFVALALLVRGRHLLPWVAAFALLQGLAAAAFFTWRPMV